MAKNGEDCNYSSDDSKEGYLVVRIGDEFKNGRYVVQSKLGKGNFSTVWLALDNHSQPPQPRYVALKVLKSSSENAEAAMEEIKNLRKIAEGDPEDKMAVVKLLDSFEHSEPNGIHICLVFELLGDNLSTLIKYSDYRGVPLHLVKQICSHILIGLDYLHRKLSIIHADLKPENILLVSKVDSSKDPRKRRRDQESENRIGKKAKKAGESSSGNYETGVKSVSQRRNSRYTKPKLLSAVNPKCKLADFGNSYSTNEEFEGVIQTREYRCPEVILGLEYSTPADIWSFACVCFELATGDLLFSPQIGDTFNEDEDHLALMMELVGRIPNKVVFGSHYASWDLFDENGDLKHIGELDFWPLEKVLVKKYKFSEKDANDMADFILPMLDFEPEKRPTAAQWLGHPWLDAGPRLLEPSVAIGQQGPVIGNTSPNKERDET